MKNELPDQVKKILKDSHALEDPLGNRPEANAMLCIAIQIGRIADYLEKQGVDRSLKVSPNPEPSKDGDLDGFKEEY